MSSASMRSSALKGSPAPLTLRSWPLVEGGREVATFLAVAVAAAIVVWLASEREEFVTLAVLLVAAGCWQLFVPSVFELDAMGITVQALGRRRRVPWSAIDQAEIGRDGVRFKSDGGGMEAFRGLYVPWGRQRDEVLAIVEYYLPTIVPST